MRVRFHNRADENDHVIENVDGTVVVYPHEVKLLLPDHKNPTIASALYDRDTLTAQWYVPSRGTYDAVSIRR